MPYIGSSNKNVNTRSLIEHQHYLRVDADTTTYPNYYSFQVNYTPGNITVVVGNTFLNHTEYVATNGKEVLIPTSYTISSTDPIEIIGYNVPTSYVLERSDVNITNGIIGGVNVTDFKSILDRLDALEAQVASLTS